MKITFQADANLDPDIGRGLRRREPSIDFQGHVGIIPDGMPDPEVLQLAADAGRVLVTADVRTMRFHFTKFIARSESPGLILIPSSRALGSIIEGLLFLWLDGTPSELRNQAMWVPRATEIA